MSETFFKTFKNDWFPTIYAIGDIHGDIMPLIVCLRDCCQVIRKKGGYGFEQNKIDKDLIEQMSKEWDDPTYVDDLNYFWCGNDSSIVLCGDILDNVRGPIDKKPGEFPFEEAKILKFINSINKKAMAEGGRIFKVLGNHDMYNLNGKVKTSYSTYVSNYAQEYPGYFYGADGRLDYFGRGKPGAKLLGEDGAYLFLMLNDFIFVHGGISSSIINVDNIEKVNSSLMKYIYDSDENNTFDKETYNIENSLTFSNESDENDGLVLDRYFGFVNNKTEEEMCTTLYNRFVNICRDIKSKYSGYSELEINRYFTLPTYPPCNPNKMKLVIGHCNQNKLTSDSNEIFKSGFTKYINFTAKKLFFFNEEYGEEVYKGEPSKETGIYGITVSCGDRDDDLNMNYNEPSIFRIDVGMSRGFNLMDFSKDYIYSRTPQVLKINYINSSKPLTTVIKSTLQNTLVHITELDNNPYKIKYQKYKSKYFKLKEKMKKL
jgi:hypothetical protein